MTISEERYIRMPLRMMYVFFAGLVLATWSYFDLRAEQTDTKKIAATAVMTGEENTRTLHAIAMKQEITQQMLLDFKDSSERMYSRYFRDLNDPDRKR